METIKTISITDAKTMADYILKNYGPMSHLKVQKLLYYTQAYHLAYFDKPLFNEDFEAWVHGPVCRDIFNLLKGESRLYSDISFDNSYNPDIIIESLASEQKSLILDVLKNLSTWTGMELESATHSELPWIEARKGYTPAEKCSEIIKKQSMMMFFKQEING